MILFLGDSFTWGQGLYIKNWLKRGRSIDDCNTFMPPMYPPELISYEDDLYRKEHHFPNLVSKKLNKSYATKFGNGGSNYDILNIIKNLDNHMDINGIDMVVVQFTEFQRGFGDRLYDILSAETYKETINEICLNQINNIDFELKKYNLPWIGLSWHKDIGDLLSTQFLNNYVPILYNNIKYTNFKELIDIHRETCIQGTYPLSHDLHLNELGHQVISNSIINKIYNTKISFRSF